MTKNIIQLLKETPIEECAPPSENIIVLSSKEKVPVALKKLVEANKVSAPVIDIEKGTFLGLLDIVDIMSFIVTIFTKEEEKEEEEIEDEIDIFKRVSVSTQFSNQEIADIVDINNNPFVPLEKGTSLYEACFLFSKKGTHRAPIVDSDGKMISIITQGDIIKFVAKHVKDLGDIGKKTVNDLKLGTKGVFTIDKKKKSIEAFVEMNQKKISGMGVIDDNGMLIGNISARDLKQVKSTNIFGLLTKSCGAFVSYIKQQSIEDTAPVISCTLETSFDFVIRRMALNKIHRLYVCDKELKATHIISLRDLISCIITHCKDDKEQVGIL